MENEKSLGSLIKDEFHIANLKLDLPDATVFYKSEWTSNRSFYVKYRAVVFLTMFVWKIYYLATVGGLFYLFLFNIQALINTLYLLAFLIVAFHGYQTEHETQTRQSLFYKWLHRMVFLLQSIGFSLSFVVSLIHWPYITVPWSVLIITAVDVFVIQLPVRILHFVYTFVVAAIYFAYISILQLTGPHYTVYIFFNWNEDPVKATLVAVTFSLVGSVLGQCINFALYRLRLYVKDLPSVRARISEVAVGDVNNKGPMQNTNMVTAYQTPPGNAEWVTHYNGQTQNADYKGQPTQAIMV